MITLQSPFGRMTDLDQVMYSDADASKCLDLHFVRGMVSKLSIMWISPAIDNGSFTVTLIHWVSDDRRNLCGCEVPGSGSRRLRGSIANR